MKNEVRQRKPIPFSWRLEKKWCKNECFLKWETECLRERNGEDSEQSQKFEGKTEKVLKTVFETQNTHFSRLIEVTNQSPRHPPKHFKPKVLKKFAKCFSRLEVSLARKSQVEPRKSLCTPRDWTFHSRKSHQNRPASSWLWHATWMTCNWVAKTGQHCFWNFHFL